MHPHNQLPPEFGCNGLLTDLHYRFTGILLAYRATESKIDEISSTPWFDPKADPSTNEQRMKDHGVAVTGYRRFVTEMAISAIAIGLESFVIDVKQRTGSKVDVWDEGSDGIKCVTDARKAMALHNVIKHNQGEIRRRSSKSARFLVDTCGFRDGCSVPLQQLQVKAADPPLIIEDLLFHVYAFGLAVVEHVSGERVTILHRPEPEVRKVFESFSIPASLTG